MKQLSRTLFALMMCTTTQLSAQTVIPLSITPSQTTPLLSDPCANYAGTFHFGDFIGMSNDHTLMDTVFLCLGDSLQVIHNQDYNLSGDPIGVTPPGVIYAIYVCPPEISGPSLNAILTDQCLLSSEPPPNNLYVIGAPDTTSVSWFVNTGYMQSTFNNEYPMMLWFAPVTIDDVSIFGFEPAVQGGPPGPCVHVNTAQVLMLVYLNSIEALGVVSSEIGNPCKGHFRLEGGAPEFDDTQRYIISDFYLLSDTSVHGIVLTPPEMLKSSVTVKVQVPATGIYRLQVQDTKSCKSMQFNMNFGSCVPVSAYENGDGPQQVSVSFLPQSDQVQVRLSESLDDATFNLYDTYGRLLQKQNLKTTNNYFNTSHLATGIYFWSVDMGGRMLESGSIYDF